MNSRILCVDDDANILAGFQRNLSKHFSIDIAESGEQGLVLIERNEPYAVILADMQMPVMNGVEFLTKAQEKCPDTVRVMLTGNADQKTAIDAVNQGHIFQFLNKPCLSETLALTLQAGVKHHRLITAERELLEKTLNGSVKVLTDILAMTDPQTFGRSEALRDCVRVYLNANPIDQPWELEIAAMLAQIGMVTIPPAVSRKIRACLRLTELELDMLARVPEVGAALLENIPRMESVAKVVHYQDKRYDGSGFPPDSIAAEEIPLGARILRVLSDLTSLRSGGHSAKTALAEMQSRQGLYDPRVLQAAANCFAAATTERVPDDRSMIEIASADLHTGHVLADKIETTGGSMIVCAGTLITPLIMEKLRNFIALKLVKQPIWVKD
jgi:response regulator RpfG family c-di-GMP phosphodiesterase